MGKKFKIMDQILCALFHKHIIVVDMNDVLDKKIENVLDQADRMFIATSVGGNNLEGNKE